MFFLVWRQNKWELPEFYKKCEANIQLQKAVSMRQQIPWKQLPVKHGIWCLCALGWWRLLPFPHLEGLMREPGSDTLLGAMLQEENVAVRHKLTLEW